MSVSAPARRSESPVPGPASMRRLLTPGWTAAAVATVVAVGIGLRFWTTSDLWLDEALSVHIARLPLADVPDALRHDGHPPLYYFVLHGWMQVFGEGDVAVRSLSGIFAVAALPLAWAAGRRYMGRGAGVLTLVLVASSPFAIRYATEARMYSLVVLLVFAGWLLIRAALQRPSIPVLLGVGATTGCLLLTHYWAFYLVAATALVLIVAVLRGTGAWRDDPAARTLAAMGLGSLLFLPWLPGFLHQLQHTGTPWAVPSRPAAIVMDSLRDLGGGDPGEARLLGWVLGLLIVLGVTARRVEGWALALDLRSVPVARPEATVVALTLAVGAAVGYATGSGFATRYFSVIFPLFVLLAARGAWHLPGPWFRTGVVALLVVLGFAMAAHQGRTQRTQGGELARAVTAEGRPGDVVVFCPDQLGPAVDRVLPETFVERPFPQGRDAARVDWVDYEERNASADPDTFATQVLDEADNRDVWLVWRSGYRTFDGKCGALVGAFRDRRSAERVLAPADVFEPAELLHFPAPR